MLGQPVEQVDRFKAGIAEQPNFRLVADEFYEILEQFELCIVPNMAFAATVDTQTNGRARFL
ncbi:MAG: hypothetical protein R2932_41850 [Caldilineaceae bacterium]